MNLGQAKKKKKKGNKQKVMNNKLFPSNWRNAGCSVAAPQTIHPDHLFKERQRSCQYLSVWLC